MSDKRKQEEEKQVYDVSVQFSKPPALEEIFPHVKSLGCIYTAEIHPPTPKNAIVHVTMVGCNTEHDINDVENGDKNGTDEMLTDKTALTSKLMQVILKDLDTSKEYSICIRTIINGWSMAQRTERIKPKLA